MKDIKRSIEQLKEDHCQRKGKSDANTSNDEQLPLDTKTLVEMEMKQWKQFAAELCDCSGSD